MGAQSNGGAYSREGAYSIEYCNSKLFYFRLLKSLEDFLTEYLNREIHYSSKDIPVSLPVSSGVAAYSRSYRPKYPHALVCSVLFKNDGDPSSSGFGDCGISINGTNVLKVIRVRLIVCCHVILASSNNFIFSTLWFQF